ncbi:hypothetical protein L7Q18_32850, partial [Achromobacter xylosoxidans]|nr:hypothetical protein [Achromobacter xylosoxidans]
MVCRALNDYRQSWLEFTAAAPEAPWRPALDGYPGHARPPAHDDMYAFTPSFQHPAGSPIRELFKYLS